MGCIKKALGEAQLRDHPSHRLSIELNAAAQGSQDVVHLQTDGWRIELTRDEFREFAHSIIEAGKKLRAMKATGALPKASAS